MRKFGLLTSIALLALAVPGLSVAQGFIPAGSPPAVYADNYGRWAIQGQLKNSFTLSPGSVCQVTQLNFRNKPTFYAFSDTLALAPVLIADVNSANSEVVTPGSYFTPTQEACGANLSPNNDHTTYTLQSGTGGLQEALNQVGGTTAPYPYVIYLSPEWYKLVSGISGLNPSLAAEISPAGIIASVTGSNNAILVDLTTSPQTSYFWNGTQYVPAASVNAWPNLQVSSYTNIAAPTALTTATAAGGMITTATTGGTIAANTTVRFGASCVDAAGGETTMSIDTASTATLESGAGTATNSFTVTSPIGCTPAAGAVGWRLYDSASTTKTELLATAPVFTQSSLTNALQHVLPAATVIPIGQSATITSVASGTSKIPQVNSAFPRINTVSLSYPPFPATAIAANTTVVPLATINLPAGYLNSLGRSFEICGQISAVTGTEGAITLTSTITTAGVVGTNSVLYTAAAGATTSTTLPIPFNFCFVYATAAVSTSASSTAGALEVHGWERVGLAGTAVTTNYQDILAATVGSLNLWVPDQLAINAVGDGTVVSATIQVRQLEVIPLS